MTAMKKPAAQRRRITMERTFPGAAADDVWDLWTTKDGIESWWGPDGFRVEVESLDLRAGGAQVYWMIAVAPEMVAFMKKEMGSDRHKANIRYTEVTPKTRLAYIHAADFIPGVEPYDVETLVEIVPLGRGTKMTLTFDAMHDEMWTERAVSGWTQELGKLEKALGAR